MTLLLTDDRAYLTSEHSDGYALGDPEAPGILLNAADTYGCAWLAEEPDEWAMPAVERGMDRRPDGHGGYAGPGTFEPRTLTLDGAVTAPSRAALVAARRRLSAALLGDLTRPFRYTHLGDAPAKGLWVYASGDPRWRALDDRVAEFAFVLVAEDPIKTGAQRTYGPVRLSVLAEGGARAPFRFPLRFPAGGTTATRMTVQNEGDEEAHAVYRIHGPVPQPVVSLSTGEYVRLNLTLSDLDEAVVDTLTGAVTVNGGTRYDAWGAGSTFPLIPGGVLDPATGEITPGSAVVRLHSAGGGTSPAAALFVDTAPAWR
jgi:hypothetical protein